MDESLNTGGRRRAPSLALLQDAAQLFESALLQARDVHLGDVEALGDLGLRDALVEAQVEDDALAPAQDVEGALEVRAVLEQLERASFCPT